MKEKIGTRGFFNGFKVNGDLRLIKIIFPERVVLFNSPLSLKETNSEK